MDSDDSHFHDTVFSTIDTKNVNHAVGSTTITRSKSEQHDEMNTETLTVDDDSTCTPSSLSSYDSESNFDKPSRTFSEDTIITTLEKVNSQNETKSGPIVKAIATAVEKIPNREKDGQQRAPNTFMTELHSNVTKRTTLPKSLAVSSMNDVGNISDALTQGKKLIENDALEEVEADTMEDISLEEEVISSSIRKNSTTANKKHTTSKEAITNHLKEITSALVSGKKPDITVPAPAPTRLHTTTSVTETVQQQSPKEEDGNRSGNNKSIIAHDENENVLIASSGASTRTSSSATSTTSRSIFNFWSPFRSMSSSSSSTTTSPSSSRRPSKQYSAPVLSATTTTSRPTSSLSPLPEFQEALLAQMEQLNTANTNDPKSKVLRNLKRQSIKHSLVTQNKGDDYDWGQYMMIELLCQHRKRKRECGCVVCQRASIDRLKEKGDR
ncbi:hypothetical protein BDF20DRAFT_876849 [Mycotypha africana]|uniref:uncharacterized protein n=1 Tax=Mycotypha africana TaxID=64632 RepID=UPI0023013CF0|nr:uncharacterized protein BDF20DRAFT_876849 [Mycotypha africana]KAI8975089.1 hypothetical protein BDF20DRAFT_876849 [Mycotypha africana]